MPNTVVLAIKKSQNTNTPQSLANGEMAYSYSSDKLYIGQTDNTSSAVSVEYIGGKLLVDKVANLESQIIGADRTFNTITASDRATVEQLVLTNFVTNGLMYTAANGMVVQASGTSGQVMQVADDGSPTFGDLTGGGYTSD
jgi:hypothetical protein